MSMAIFNSYVSLPQGTATMDNYGSESIIAKKFLKIGLIRLIRGSLQVVILFFKYLESRDRCL